MYTSERLEIALRDADSDLNAEQIVDEIFRSVNQFALGAEQYDDMTVVVLKVNGKGEVI
jgi:serine phosphatase RsbU (regulator of sigma subunit)